MLTQADAVQLLNWGWSKDKILKLNTICVNKFTEYLLNKNSFLIGNRFLVYPESDLLELIHALENTDINDTVAYCDGSGTTEWKDAGIGVYIEENGVHYKSISEHIGTGTNNRAELMAIYRGLRAIPDIRRSIVIRSDSQYAMGAVTHNWKYKKNQELIAIIKKDLEYRKGRVQFEHVRGHSGIFGNEIADKLARDGRLKVML